MLMRRRVVIAGCVAVAVMLGAIVAHRARPSGGQSPSSGAGHAAGATLVVIDSHNRLYVNGVLTPPDDLVARVRRALRDKGTGAVYLKGDKNARYAAILDAMETLHDAAINVHLL